MKYIFAVFFVISIAASQPFIRVNQLGFLPTETKTAIVLSDRDLANNEFRIIDRNTKRYVLTGPLWDLEEAYGRFKYVYRINFTALQKDGSYAMIVDNSDSSFIKIGKNVYHDYLSSPLNYLLTQRCGDNSVLGKKCHDLDAIAVDGLDRGTPFDMTGGYHETSSYSRFLETTSYSVGILLMAYKDYPGLWKDMLDAKGRNGSNKIPDILDEVKWGLDWMLKMYPDANVLYHQIGDDRGSAQNAAPYQDSSDFGWGRGRQRPAYFATGKPQGLFNIKNSSSGISNVAGRTAAVFALASSVWRKENYDLAFSDKLILKAKQLYEMAKANPGCLESVPCKKPDRFQEKNFYDDLEWAAAELFRVTGNQKYLDDGVEFSKKSADESWMGMDTLDFYEYFPFVNLGHYELYHFVAGETQKKLRDYYRLGLQRAFKAAGINVFDLGVPFVVRSNNLSVALITQIIFYKKMGGSFVFDELLRDTRDFLLGRNPWGQSFVIKVPGYGKSPNHPSSFLSSNLKINLEGGLVSGPVSHSIINSGTGKDNYAQFQSDQCIYRDEDNDNIINEPTLDGSASLMYVLAHLSHDKKTDSDSDGITDDDEVLKYRTDPTKADTDGDGISDGSEIANGTDPLNPNDSQKKKSQGRN
jgi:endoglucanase